MLIQAHRGYSACYPENTLLAFERALAVGVDILEMDLAVSSDGHVVILHDRTVDRTTNGSGPVDALTLDELRSLDAGSHFDPQFAGESIPTLEEVVYLARGRAALNLEIKGKGRSDEVVERTLCGAVGVLERAGVLDQVIFSSFSVDLLLEVERFAPGVRRLLIDWSDPQGDAPLAGIESARRHGFWGWATKRTLVDERRVKAAKQAGLRVLVGLGKEVGPFIDDLAAWNVDGLSTDDPGRLVSYLEDRELR